MHGTRAPSAAVRETGSRPRFRWPTHLIRGRNKIHCIHAGGGAIFALGLREFYGRRQNSYCSLYAKMEIVGKTDRPSFRY
jgi:hypothetical protein